MRAPRLLFVAAVLPVAACLPARDNKNDPSLRPVPVLQFSSGPNDHATGCGAPDNLFPSFNRARCLYIDTTGSSDPQDDIVDGVLELSTAGIFTQAGDHGVSLASGLTPAAPRIVLKASQLPASVQPGPHELRLTLTDAQGHSASTTLAVTLVNNLPIAVAPSPRQLPYYGAVWNGGAGPLITHLDGGASVDPDGDRPLYYRWTIQSGGAFVSGGATAVWSTDAGLALTISPLGSTGSVVLELDVSDGTVQPGTGERVFTSAFTQVNLDEPTQWAFEEDTGDLIQLDLDRRIYQANMTGNLQTPRGRPALDYAYTTIGVTPHVIPDATTLYFVSDILNNGNFQLQARLLSSTNSVASAIVTTEEPLSVILAPETVPPTPRTVWVTTQTATSHLHLWAYDQSLTLIDDLDTGLPLANKDEPGAAFDPNTGELWIAPSLSTAAHGFNLAGNTIVAGSRSITLDQDHFITGISARKNASGESEIWVVESANVLQGAAPGTVAQLKVLRGTSATEEDASLEDGNGGTLSFPTAIIGFDFTGLGDAWVGLAGVGILSMHVVDSPSLPPTLVFRTIATEAGLGFDIAVNHQSGILLAVSNGHHRIERFGLNGTFTKADTSTRIDSVLGFDIDGRVWMEASDPVTGDAVIVRGLGAGVEGIVARFSAPLGLGSPVADYATGDAWIPSVFPAGVQRDYSDGREADFVRGITDVGFTASRELPPPSLLTVDPETGWLWTFGGGSPGGNAGSTRGFVLAPYAARDVETFAVSPYAPLGEVVDYRLLASGDQILGAAALANVPDHAAVLLVRTAGATNVNKCTNGGGATYKFELRRIGSDGTVGGSATVFPNLCQSVASRTESVQLSRDLQTNEICVAVVDSANNVILRSRRYTPSLTAIGAFSKDIPFGPGGGQIDSIAASRNACWIGHTAGSNQGQIEAIFRSGAGPVRTVTSSGGSPGGSLRMTVLSPTLGHDQVYSGALVTEVWGGGTNGAIQKYVLDSSSSPSLVRANTDQLAVPFRTRLLSR